MEIDLSLAPKAKEFSIDVVLSKTTIDKAKSLLKFRKEVRVTYQIAIFSST